MQTIVSEIAIPMGVVGLAPGNFRTMVVRKDGSVWSTGANINSDARNESFVKVIASGATAAATGNYYSIVLKHDGTVWTTGRDSKGRLSFFDGSITGRHKFLPVKTILRGKAVAAGGYHSMVLTQEGNVWATGWNKYGQLGDKTTHDRTRLTRVISDETWKAVAVATGDIHSIVLMEHGSVWGTGRNYNGQLGDGSKADRSDFVQVMSSGAANVAAGGYHSMVLKQDGSVWATGCNEYGQLGDGSTKNRINYVQMVSSGAKSLAAGRRHSLMLKQDGTVWATGHNRHGQLGDGPTISTKVFRQVIPGGTKAVAAGAFHSMAVNQDGSIWATGSNQYGQFGDGSRTSQNKFTRLIPFVNGESNEKIILTQGYFSDRSCFASPSNLVLTRGPVCV